MKTEGSPYEGKGQGRRGPLLLHPSYSGLSEQKSALEMETLSPPRNSSVSGAFPRRGNCPVDRLQAWGPFQQHQLTLQYRALPLPDGLSLLEGYDMSKAFQDFS